MNSEPKPLWSLETIQRDNVTFWLLRAVSARLCLLPLSYCWKFLVIKCDNIVAQSCLLGPRRHCLCCGESWSFFHIQFAVHCEYCRVAVRFSSRVCETKANWLSVFFQNSHTWRPLLTRQLLAAFRLQRTCCVGWITLYARQKNASLSRDGWHDGEDSEG